MAHMSIIEIRRIAVELECDPRSVEAEINGRRVRGVVGERIRHALAARGITPSSSAPDAVRRAAAATRTNGRPFL